MNSKYLEDLVVLCVLLRGILHTAIQNAIFPELDCKCFWEVCFSCFFFAVRGASLTVVEDDESDKESVDKGWPRMTSG